LIVNVPAHTSTVSYAYFALHKTLKIVEHFEEKIVIGTEVTFEAFLSSSQNLKVTRVQGGPQTIL
jgi:hypothetical protein